jgi:hypothetical protein
MYKKLNDNNVLLATIACPVSARLALIDGGFEIEDKNTEVKKNLDNIFNCIKYDQISSEDCIKVYHKIIKMCQSIKNPNKIAEKLLIISDQLKNIEREKWKTVISSVLSLSKYTKNDNCNISNNFDDRYVNLINIFLNQIATRKKQIIQVIIKNASDILEDGTEIFEEKLKIWNNCTKIKISNILSNFIQAKLSEIIFPYGGYFNNPYDDIRIILAEYTLLKFCLISELSDDKKNIEEEKIVNIIQAIDREFYSKKKDKIIKFINDIDFIDIQTIIGFLRSF